MKPTCIPLLRSPTNHFPKWQPPDISTVIALQEQYLSEWLSPYDVSRDRLEEILSAKETPHYIHQIAA